MARPAVKIAACAIGVALSGAWGVAGEAPALPAPDTNPAKALATLLPLLAGEDLAARTAAENALRSICLRCGAPGAEADRLRLCRAMSRTLADQAFAPARPVLLRMLADVGRSECAAAVAAFLSDEETPVRQQAARTLAANPSPEAAAALRKALAQANDPSRQIELIGAVAYRRDAEAVGPLEKVLSGADEKAAAAAAEAMGRIGGMQVARALANARKTDRPGVAPAVLRARLRCADGLLAGGSPEPATEIFKDLYGANRPHWARLAALRGMVEARKEQALADLVGAIRGGSPRMQLDACALINRIPGQAAAKAFIAELDKLPPVVQAAVLTALAERNDPTVRPAAVKLAGSTDRAVRFAALLALANMGDTSAILPLAAAAAGESDSFRKYRLRESLAHLGVSDDAFSQAMGSADGPAKVELIGALDKRQASAQAAKLVPPAVEDPNPAVRLSALKALAALGGEAQLPALVKVLAGPKSPQDRAAAEKAVGMICRRIADPDKRLICVLGAWDAGSPQTHASLVRVMGWVGDDAALARIADLLQDGDSSVREAAARVLIDWPDAKPAAPVLDIARNSSNQKLRSLALRGYVRMADSRTDAQEKLAMCRSAWALAKGDDERRAVLGVLSRVPMAKALELAAGQMDDKAIGREAQWAVIRIAEALVKAGGADRDAIRQALTKLLSVAQDPAIRSRAKSLLPPPDAASSAAGTGR